MEVDVRNNRLCCDIGVPGEIPILNQRVGNKLSRIAISHGAATDPSQRDSYCFEYWAMVGVPLASVLNKRQYFCSAIESHPIHNLHAPSYMP